MAGLKLTADRPRSSPTTETEAPTADHSKKAAARYLRWAVSIVIALSLAVLLLTRPIFWAACSAPLQGMLQALSGVEEGTGSWERERASQVVRDYFRSRAPGIMDAPGFSYRERKHFEEVKRLLSGLDRTGRFALWSLFLLAPGVWIVTRRRPPSLVKLLALSAWTAAALLGLALAALAGLALGFDLGFVALHRLLFEGRHWILPPDALTLKLYPRAFFVTAAQVYASTILTLTIALCVSAQVLARTSRKHSGSPVNCPA